MNPWIACICRSGTLLCTHLYCSVCLSVCVCMLATSCLLYPCENSSCFSYFLVRFIRGNGDISFQSIIYLVLNIAGHVCARHLFQFSCSDVRTYIITWRMRVIQFKTNQQTDLTTLLLTVE